MLLECCVGLVGDSTEWFSLWWLCPGEADFLFSLSPWLTHFHSSHNALLMQQLNCRNYCHFQIFYTSLDISFLSVTKFWKPHFDKNQGLCFLSTVKYFKFIPLTVKLLKITKIFQLIFTKIISVYFHQNYFRSFSPKLFHCSVLSARQSDWYWNMTTHDLIQSYTRTEHWSTKEQ